MLKDEDWRCIKRRAMRYLERVHSATGMYHLVIVDEVEKTGTVESSRGTRYALADALLPLLKRMTAKDWECPFFQIELDMSWVGWVLTANARSREPIFVSALADLECRF